MKKIRIVGLMCMLCFLRVMFACADAAGTVNPTDTLPQTEVPTEEETLTPIRYVYSFGEEYRIGGIKTYQELCIGASTENSDPPMWKAYDLSLQLGSPVIYAIPNLVFSVPSAVYCQSSQMYYGGAKIEDFDITWRIAEPELLEVVSVHPLGFLGRQGGTVQEIPTFELPEGQMPGFAVRTLAPGTAHLYITVTHRETGVYQTMQQIIVIEE